VGRPNSEEEHEKALKVAEKTLSTRDASYAFKGTAYSIFHSNVEET
jgi:hypothetical protein